MTALYVPRPGGLAINPALINALQAHAQAAGTVLTRAEITGYVALGEHAVHAIQQTGTALARRLGAPVVHAVNPPIALTPNLEVMRGISWYMAACAAQQDANQQAAGAPAMVNGQVVTELSHRGIYVFRDPDHALYRFMQSSPLAYSRISTHFNERSASMPEGGAHAEQRGIEDYGRRLPGRNGAILFDRLQNAAGQPEMFVKFEVAGFPKVSTSAQRVDDMGQGRASVWRALKRKIQHALSFIGSRCGGARGVDRKEHVHKGLLKASVYEPFMQVMKAAHKRGLSTGMSPAAHAEQAKTTGLPHIEGALAALQQTIGAQPDLSPAHLDLLHSLTETQASIIRAKAQLGAQSDHLGIERRGAEVHLDLNVQSASLQEAHRGFAVLEGSMAQPQAPVLMAQELVTQDIHLIPAGVNTAAARDWDRNGVSINGTHYPGQGQRGYVSAAGNHPSTLEQACSALVHACGNHPVAAEWISRFAHQGLAVPMLEYLATESLGTVGPGLLVRGGMQTFAINTLPNGSVEVTMDYHYQNSAHNPEPLTYRYAANEPQFMHPQARLHATVTLRFDNLSAYTAGTAPVPVISSPLTYTTSHFDRAPMPVQ